MAGAPHEYLNRIFVKGWFEKWDEMSIADYLGRLMEINTSPNGIFGLKTHYHQLEATVLSQGLELDDLLPNPTYIRIGRGDTIRQAISFSRANQTNSWSIEEKELRSPAYNPVEIYARLKEVVEDELGWDGYFRDRNIVPLRLSYEELENNFRATIRQVLDYLDLEEAVARIVAPPMGKQRDSVTEDWYRRFIDDIEPSGLSSLRHRLRSGLRNWLG
jgi:LPS sulfotransferase NodH